MCGIVGYVGKQNATDVLIDGLRKLEYRGYDSAGIAVFENHKIVIEKAKGRLDNLEQKMHSAQQGAGGQFCGRDGKVDRLMLDFFLHRDHLLCRKMCIRDRR